MWHLRYAFSIEPAARRLVTSGPYAISRHLVYAGYIAQYLGMLITRPAALLGSLTSPAFDICTSTRGYCNGA